jgi:ribonuclease E
VLEGSTVPCPHCTGTGLVRSTSSIALHVLRVLEDSLIKSSTHNMTVRTRMEVALYILNSKRSHLREIERRFGVTISVVADETLTGTVFHALERGEPAVPPVEFDHKANVVQVDSIDMSEFEEIEETEEEEAEEPVEKAESDDDESEESEGRNGDDDQRRRRRRRRRRGGGRDRDQAAFDPSAPQPSDDGLLLAAELGGDLPAQLAPISDGEVDEADAEADAAALESPDQNGDPRRRRRRGRRNRRDGEREPRNGDTFERPPGYWAPSRDERAETSSEPVESSDTVNVVAAEEPTPASAPAVMTSEAPMAEAAPAPISPPEPVVAVAPVVPQPAEPTTPEPPPARLVEEPEAAPPTQRKTGWWQRAKATFGGN